MFFFLSKTLSYLSMPIVWITGLFIAGLVWKNPIGKKRCMRAGVVLLLFLSNAFIANEFAQWWEIPVTPMAEVTQYYEYGIVLTGVTKLDLEPNDRVYFGRGADRVTHTLQLYKQKVISKILVSGGSGRLGKVAKQEADDLADAFLLMGVPAEDIIIENKSRNTHESAVALKTLYPQLSSGNGLLITSAYHMRRARACFRKVGFEFDTFSADFISQPRRFTPDMLIIPQTEALTVWHVLIREWVGMMAYRLVGYI